MVKEGKCGKVLDRGVTMMFIGYSLRNPLNCFKMFNPNTGRVMLSRDIICLGRMFYPRLNMKVTNQLPIISIPVTLLTVEDTKQDGIDIKIITDGPSISKEREGVIVKNLLWKKEMKDGSYIRLVMVVPLGEMANTIQHQGRQ
jgi:hypothetical protein